MIPPALETTIAVVATATPTAVMDARDDKFR